MSIQTNSDLPDDRSSLPGSILEHIADAVASADETGTIRRWNRAATELFGYGPAEARSESRSPLICLSSNRPSSRS